MKRIKWTTAIIGETATYKGYGIAIVPENNGVGWAVEGGSRGDASGSCHLPQRAKRRAIRAIGQLIHKSRCANPESKAADE